jgi:acetoin utilization protein AcuB
MNTAGNDTSLTVSKDGFGQEGNGAVYSARCVADIMTKEVISLLPHHSFGEAVHLMANSPFRHFVVLHPDGRLAGVFSDRDVLRALGRTPNWQPTCISGVMTRNVITVKPETLLSVAAGQMISRRVSCLPVVGENDKVCGILTSTDLLRAYQSIQESLERNQT